MIGGNRAPSIPHGYLLGHDEYFVGIRQVRDSEKIYVKLSDLEASVVSVYIRVSSTIKLPLQRYEFMTEIICCHIVSHIITLYQRVSKCSVTSSKSMSSQWSRKTE